jgi:membrane protease YdiL (CAAX protease family)
MVDFLLAALLALALLVALAASGRLGFIADEISDGPRRIAALVLFWSVLVLCVFLPTVSPGAAMEIDPETIWFPSLFTGQFILAGFVLSWWWLGRPVSLARFLFLENATREHVRVGFVVGAVGWVCAILASATVALILTAIGYGPIGDAEPLAPPFEVPPLLIWLTELPAWRKLVVVSVAMTVEEAFYRAFLQTRIGWVLSSALFALSHGGYGLPTLTASVFAVSLVLGWALRARGNLLPCIVAHGVFDAVQLFVVMPIAVGQLRSLA